ncbi:MAG: RNA methyltransferase [Chitinophagaceae bacterium]
MLILDNVRSMHNVGSVFRTADAFLLQGIVLCGFTPVPPHRDIQKTALGATETVSWAYASNTLEAVQQWRAKGYGVWAAEQTVGSIPLQDFQPRAHQPLAIVFGNEVCGVDEKVLEYLDGSLEIPQMGMKHSLNLAVSAGIVVWELFKKLT